MHILVVNDDGPPSKRLAPYIRPFVNALQDAGHEVSVVLPDASRSWIGKAHLVGQTLTATYVSPESLREEDGSFHGASHPSHESDKTHNEWVIVNGTPASCTQLGIYNLFPDRPPIDLVVSGPNHGRNASTIYNLSSGTVGGALEAATCGKRGIALSFASKDAQPREVIKAASRRSVKVIEHLCQHWDDGVELYNLNIPMRPDVEKRPVRYSSALRNYWTKGSLFHEVDEKQCPPTPPAEQIKERRFAWSPELSDIKKSVQFSEPGTDAHTVTADGAISVTPLIANFFHIIGPTGDIDIDI